MASSSSASSVASASAQTAATAALSSSSVESPSATAATSSAASALSPSSSSSSSSFTATATSSSTVQPSPGTDSSDFLASGSVLNAVYLISFVLLITAAFFCRSKSRRSKCCPGIFPVGDQDADLEMHPASTTSYPRLERWATNASGLSIPPPLEEPLPMYEPRPPSIEITVGANGANCETAPLGLESLPPPPPPQDGPGATSTNGGEEDVEEEVDAGASSDGRREVSAFQTNIVDAARTTSGSDA
ncbi:hypothetical protein DFJ73DRAFT_833011 [Zopfochytrium polystomum]|nr:hypothetical protein DFJ73DRAFT_833011 [Zopfochytrium polystomum]